MKACRIICLLLTAGLTVNVFAAKPTVTLTLQVDGAGTVTSSPAGLNCPTQCSSIFPKASSVSLTAIPTQGQTFLGWAGACSGIDPICDIKITGNETVAASFTQQQSTPAAPIPRTGQTECFDPTIYPQTTNISCAATKHDGDLQKGIPWPNPRFTINNDGTVTDELTGLVWLRNADCFGRGTIAESFTYANSLSSGSCGLSDGSVVGDWRIPNVRELYSLVYYGPGNYIRLSDTSGTGDYKFDGQPFINAGNRTVWTSTFSASVGAPSYHTVNFGLGHISSGDTSVTRDYYGIWPVRDAK